MNAILHGMMDAIVSSIAQSVPIFYDIVSQRDCLWVMSLWLSNGIELFQNWSWQCRSGWGWGFIEKGDPKKKIKLNAR